MNISVYPAVRCFLGGLKSFAKQGLGKFFLLGLLFFSTTGHAFQPLPVGQAFAFSTSIASDQHTLIATWKIAPGFHLYRDRFTFDLQTPNAAHLGEIILPPGIPQHDDILGNYQVYQNEVAINVPFTQVQPQQLILAVSYQGCADAGFCYPPVTKQVRLNGSNGAISLVSATDNVTTPAATALASAPSTATISAPTSTAVQNQSSQSASVIGQNKMAQLFAGKNWPLIFAAFLGFGLLLAFTPCVLPMIPILSGIILGEGREITTYHAFTLSLTYILAMAITYAIAGVLVGYMGSYVQAFLQNPWVITIFSLMFVMLALSLFGFYELRMPNFLHHHVTKLSNKQQGGTYVGVAIMGGLSTLIVSPCVSAPLIGVLTYIAKTGDAVLGGAILFTMGIGMGIPMLILGTVGGKFIPRAGHWMNVIKAIFGVLLLGVAILLLSRIISEHIVMLLWAGLLIMVAIYMGAFTAIPMNGGGKLWKGLSLILLVYGFLLLVGTALGNTDPLQPLAIKQAIPVANLPQAEPFRVVNNLQEAQNLLATAKAQGRPVMLDFYADWCISCKEMDKNVFNDPYTQRKLAGFLLLRADVTANDAAARELEKYFGVIAPPTVLFFDESGQELTSSRVVGEVSSKELLGYLQQCSGK